MPIFDKEVPKAGAVQGRLPKNTCLIYISYIIVGDNAIFTFDKLQRARSTIFNKSISNQSVPLRKTSNAILQ